jgi:hypothetical protein
VPEYEEEEDYYDDVQAPDDLEMDDHNAKRNLNLMDVQTLRQPDTSPSQSLQDTAPSTKNVTYIMGQAIGDKMKKKKKRKDRAND